MHAVLDHSHIPPQDHKNPMGDKQITDEFIENLSKKFNAQEWQKIANDSSYTTTWIYDVIKKARTLAEEKQ